MDAEKVDEAVEALTDDYHRTQKKLTQNQVERALARRRLSTAESVAVFDQLAESGLLENDEEQLAALAEATAPADDDPPPNAVPPELDSQQRNASDLLRAADDVGLLGANEEAELGRAISLAQQAESDLRSGTVERTATVSQILDRGNHARERLTTANIRLVFNIAHRYVNVAGIDLDDLIQEGLIGLGKAVERYNYTLGFRFTTYATWWIRQSITRAMADQGRMVRLPVHVSERLAKIRKAERTLTRYNNGREPTLAELADELEWSKDYVQFIRDISREPASLNTPIDEDEGTELGDMVATDVPPPERFAEGAERTEIIEKAVASLNEREADIIQRRYGLTDGRPMTLEQVGQAYGVTRERIRQIQAKVEKRLSRTLQNRYPEYSDN